jgi:hypothetical protein
MRSIGLTILLLGLSNIELGGAKAPSDVSSQRPDTPKQNYRDSA